jgi:hypothetical protein
MRVTQIFLLLFCFFYIYIYIYRRSDLEGSCSNDTKTRHVNLVAAFGPQRVTRSNIGLHDLQHLRKGIFERMMHVLRRSGPRVVSLSPCFRCDVWGMKYCWNRCSSIKRFRNKFIIFLPCGLLVNNNTFSKRAFLKVLLATLIMVVMF